MIHVSYLNRVPARNVAVELVPVFERRVDLWLMCRSMANVSGYGVVSVYGVAEKVKTLD